VVLFWIAVLARLSRHDTNKPTALLALELLQGLTRLTFAPGSARAPHSHCLVLLPAGRVVLLFVLHRQAQHAQPKRR
jgi:hypothetical protein